MPYTCTLQFCEVEKQTLRGAIEQLQSLVHDQQDTIRELIEERDIFKRTLNKRDAERDALKAAITHARHMLDCGFDEEAVEILDAAIDAARGET